MTVLFVILMLLAFLGIDYLVRKAHLRHQTRHDRLEREAILNVAVRLEFNDEAKSLKRVEVPSPKARILAVDDEAVVLDSFRRILVLEGYNIDTVQSGPEALSLVRRNDYDFVFTDLKMPDMDGVEVVKAVKHLRPDVDMVVITGYGTIETAVETMQSGACEYVQKPFSADELAAFINKLLVKRQARLEALRQPTVRIVSPSQAEATPSNEYCIPGGSFIAPGHTWVRIEPDGQIRIGIDDFANKALGAVATVVLPKAGTEIRCGEPLFSCKRGSEEISFVAPMSGKVQDLNAALLADPARLTSSPYKDGWVCRIEPSDLTAELGHLKIGRPVVEWYGEEIGRLQTEKNAQPDPTKPLPWSVLQQGFLAQELVFK
jgi:ActR/RegA family two-component response regulator/glycine cleavage system H lipoate-binding protein